MVIIEEDESKSRSRNWKRNLKFLGKLGKLAGKWIGPGRNKRRLGLVPDTVVASVGKQFENYKGKEALQKEVDALVNSKDGRRFARSYD